MSVPVSSLLNPPTRLEVYCHNPACSREAAMLRPEDAVKLLGPEMPISEAGSRFRCAACGERRRIHCRASMTDFYYWVALQQWKQGQGPAPRIPAWMQG